MLIDSRWIYWNKAAVKLKSIFCAWNKDISDENTFNEIYIWRNIGVWIKNKRWNFVISYIKSKILNKYKCKWILKDPTFVSYLWLSVTQELETDWENPPSKINNLIKIEIKISRSYKVNSWYLINANIRF